MAYRAWRVDEADGPFREVELAGPELKRNEVLVRISASGVNLIDTKIRAGQAAHAKQPLPAVLGLDMAGEVEEVGSEVSDFKPGDQVYGMVGGVGGHQGTLAEMIVADEDLLAFKPKSLSMREAAALPLSVITAWEGLVDRAAVSLGDTVLVHAGAGGVGHVVVQLAKAFGARVFATVSPEKSEIVKQFGATPVDYRSMTVEEYVNAATDGEGFDIVYDTLGGATLDASLKAVRTYSGHVVSCMGWGTHSLAPLSFREATYSGVFTLLPLITGENRLHHGEILMRAAKFADEGKLRPLTNERTFTTDGIEKAHEAVANGALGKVVVEI
jgi:NADPH2:quinone reductase